MKIKTLKILLPLFLFASLYCFGQTNPRWDSGITINPPAPVDGDTMTFSAVLKVAKGPVQNLKVVAGIDGAPIYQNIFPSLLKSQTMTISFKWKAVAGSHTVYFEIDPDHISPDDTPADNLLQNQFNVQSTIPPRQMKANLKIKNVLFIPNTLVDGAKIGIQVQIINDGDLASTQAEVILKENGSKISEMVLMPVNPGGNQSLLMNYTVKCGAGLELAVDPYNKVDEKNEGDNNWSGTASCSNIVIERAITPRGIRTGIPIINPSNVKMLLNIVPTLYWTPGNFKPGDEVTFNYSVRNNGPGTADPRPAVIFSIDPGFTKATAPGAPGSTLAAGGSKSMIVKHKIECTNKPMTVKVKVDPDNQVIETNEGDNEIVKVFQNLGCANLSFAETRFGKCRREFGVGIVGQFGHGDECVSLSYRVKNIGSAKSPSAKFFLIVNGSQLLQDYIPPLDPGQEDGDSWLGWLDCGDKIVLKIVPDEKMMNFVSGTSSNTQSFTFNCQ